jgi:hypothetical protein
MTMRPTKQAIAEMTQAVMRDMAEVRDVVGPTDAMAGVESFIAIALRVFAQTNSSKLREVMRLVEIQARMDGREVISPHP